MGGPGALREPGSDAHSLDLPTLDGGERLLLALLGALILGVALFGYQAPRQARRARRRFEVVFALTPDQGL